MKIRLILSANQWAGWRLSTLVTGSALLHGAVVSGVLSYYPATVASSVFSSRYQVQILRLAPQVDWPTPAALAAALRSRENKAAAKQVAPARSLAPQTLIVEGASAEWKLARPIPLPAIVSEATPRPLPLHVEQVRVDGPEPRQVAQSANPAAALPPVVKVISLPDKWTEVESANVVPAVKQWAAESGATAAGGPASEGPESAAAKGDSPATATSAQQAALDKMLTRIDLPMNGRPAVSVEGESLAEQYPETAGQIRGHMVSTIYIRIGLRKNWTLEYWAAPGSQSAQKVDAPWPYLLYRPEMPLPEDANAVLVRGVLTADGNLEHLALLLPQQWARKEDLFRALGQWKFRPAMRNTQPQAVEVLLVIPRQPEE